MVKESLHILSINNFSNVNERVKNIELALKDRNHKIFVLGDKIMVWTYEDKVVEEYKDNVQLNEYKNNEERR